VHEVIQSVKRVSGVDFRVVLGPRRAGDPASVVASPVRARAVLGWLPQAADLDEVVRDALAWEMRVKTAHLAATGSR
jgi:UDP-glucose 4-epimerase